MKTNVRRWLSAVSTNRTHSIALGVAALAVTGVVASATSGASAAPETAVTGAVAEQSVAGSATTSPAKKATAKQAATKQAATKQAAAKKTTKPAAKAKTQVVWRSVKPVAGLSQAQMNNAQRIVNQGRVMGLPKRALVLAVACAMQESRLTNLASTVVPQSYNYWNEGEGSDHDSVGLFQQRSSSGWGSVKNLMWPAYSSKQFYNALKQVPGWQNMPLTYAIQAVQVSAFPEAYAKHEGKAQAVVNALLK